ncbi:MAG: C-terminal binding protein [Dongiaceae bacterium]
MPSDPRSSRTEPPLVLTPDAEYEGAPDLEEQVFAGSVRLATYRAHLADEIPERIWGECEGMLAWHNIQIDETLIPRLSRCRIIVRVGAGFDNMALEPCGRAGIAICNVPDYGVNEVSDHAIALMLALDRAILRYHEAIVADPVGGWVVPKVASIRRLPGMTFGVVGMGRIGTAAARKAAAFGLRVLFYDPHLPTGTELALGYARADSLESLLAQADIVSLHTPLTPQTQGLIGRAALARMKPDAVLINTARGAVVDVEALAEALESGRLGGAGIDVLPEEPPLPSSRLVAAVCRREPWTIGRVILTPHAAWYSRESAVDVRRKAALTARDFLRDGKLRDCVNREFLRPGR